MDNQRWDLDVWNKVVEKTVNVEAIATLQSPSGTKEIDSKYPKSYKPSAKKDKDENTYQDMNKAKNHNFSPANTSQSQTQASKKDKYYRKRQRGYLATRVNATMVVKKEKNKVKDLNYVKCYTYK